MIEHDRFMANKALDFDGWVEARRSGVTATEIAKAATPSGFKELMMEFTDQSETYDNPYLEFGRRMEGPIAMWLKDQVGVMPNEWLIAGEQRHHLATPDGLSLDHSQISEIKTTGRDWETVIPIQYRRQIQWQLHVTGAESCFFAWMLRVEDAKGDFQPGWIDPKWMIVERDQKMIDDLVKVAENLHTEKRRLFDA
jgi:hypothetical protein